MCKIILLLRFETCTSKDLFPWNVCVCVHCALCIVHSVCLSKTFIFFPGPHYTSLFLFPFICLSLSLSHTHTHTHTCTHTYTYAHTHIHTYTYTYTYTQTHTTDVHPEFPHVITIGPHVKDTTSSDHKIGAERKGIPKAAILLVFTNWRFFWRLHNVCGH